jgi:hypothetical protein
MARRYARLAPDHLRRAAEKPLALWNTVGKQSLKSARKLIDSMGWLMGREATTTGITSF